MNQNLRGFSTYVALLSSTAVFISGCGKPAAPANSATTQAESSVHVTEKNILNYAGSSPFVVNWTDRRPIGELVLAPVDGNGAYKDGFSPGNPRGWLNDKTINITTAAGITNFQSRILAYADQSISVLQGMGAQGMITWDLEGEEYPQDTTYIGAPDLVPTMAPEMESVITDSTSPYYNMKLDDAYFKKFRDAGFKVGMTLRPQQMEFNNSTDCHLSNDLFNTCQPFSTDENSQIANLQRKVAYAQSRWGASIFYVDSNVVADQYWKCAPSDPNQDPSTCPDPMLLSNGRSRLGSVPLDLSVFQAVIASNPNSLFIPEHHYTVADAPHADYFTATAPLYQLFQDFPNGALAYTSSTEEASVPGAFTAIIINNAGMTVGDAHYQQLVKGQQQGDIMIARAWWSGDPDLTVMHAILAAAATLPQAPRVIPGSAVYLGSISATTATLTWATHDPASSQVFYGTSASYGSSSTLNSTLVTSHSVTLASLKPATTYHFNVQSKDAHGTLGASSDFTFTTPAAPAPSPSPSPTKSPTPTPVPSPAASSVIRVAVAHSSNYTDSTGLVWSADEDYSGGTSWISSNHINDTNDSGLYDGERYGNIAYNFSVANGSYVVKLKFAEVWWTAVGQRKFNAQINGEQVLTNFDIIAAAGAANTAIDESFPVTVTNGKIALNFISVVDNAKISAIEISTAGAEPAAPLFALRAATTGYTDTTGVKWSADMDSSGGNFGATTSSAIAGTNDSPLYQSERYGNMTYTFPVADGSHEITLKFAEIYWTTTGQRIFNVAINGVQVLTNFDITASAGGTFRALDKTFTADVTQGQIQIVFTSVKDSAKISAIEIH